MADRPLEAELMLTTYTQMGQQLADELDHLDVFIPSGIEEHELGFDMQLPNLKGIVLQFKRPYGDTTFHFYTRYSAQDPPRQLDNMKNWELVFGPRAAFYAFPLVVDHDDLGETLQRTAFVPASAMDPFTSVVHLPDDYIVDGSRIGTKPVELYCSSPRVPSINHTSTISPPRILGWNELNEAIADCTAAFRMRWHGEPQQPPISDDYHFYPQDERDFEVESTADWFLGASGPYLTRMGTEGEFGW